MTDLEGAWNELNAGRYSIAIVTGIDPGTGAFESLAWIDGAVNVEQFELAPTDWSVTLRS